MEPTGKKVVIVDAFGTGVFKPEAALLCGISEERLDLIADYVELPHGPRFSAVQARAAVAGLTLNHEVLILVGPETLEAFSLDPREPGKPFTCAFGGGVHLGIYIPRKKQKEHERRALMRVLGDVVAMCQVPVSESDVKIAVAVVKNLGDENISFWTRKVLNEIEDKLEAGKAVDKWDLGQLMFCFAKDVRILNGG